MKLISVSILVCLIAVGIYFRVLQVAIFTAAAFLAPSRNDFSVPREAAASWAAVSYRRAGRPFRTSRTAVTYHPEYENFQVSQAVRCLEEAAALGVEFVRVDVRWGAVLPDGESPNETAFAWYRSFFETARECGLEPIIVLSSPPRSVRRIPKHELLDRWRVFVEQVVSRLGDLCNMYQVMNEPNNPVYSIFDSETLPEAVMSASRSIKSHVTGAKVLVNFLMDIPHWRSNAARLLSETGTSIDIVGVDHYPGTWAIGRNKGWASSIRMLSGIDTADPASPWYHREFAIVETGFSTNLPPVRGPAEQECFFLDLERNLQSFGHLGNRLLFVGFYELCDSNSHAILNPEAHFGLIEDDCTTRKPAFAIAQRISLRGIFK